MADQATGTLDEHAADAAGTADAEGFDESQSPTPSPMLTAEADSEKLAQNPEIQKVFSRVFGTEGQEAEGDAATEAKPPATRSARQRREEQADELAGLKANEADDGVEPDGEGEAELKGGGLEKDQAKEGEGEEAEPRSADDAPTLNPVLRQAAKRAGWTDEKIDSLYALDREAAEDACTQILRSFNNLSTEYGRLGPRQAGQQQAAPQTQTPPPPPPPPPPAGQEGLLENLYGKEKVAELNEKYDKAFMDDVIAPLLGPVREVLAVAEKQRTEAMATEIGNFFRGLPKEFASLYGEGNQVAEEQFGNRASLAQVADQIREGAMSQGIELSVSECLDRANLMFASEHMGELERKKIADKVQKRSDRLTERPSRRAKAVTGGEKSDAAAISAYEDAAAELGYNVSA